MKKKTLLHVKAKNPRDIKEISKVLMEGKIDGMFKEYEFIISDENINIYAVTDEDAMELLRLALFKTPEWIQCSVCNKHTLQQRISASIEYSSDSNSLLINEEWEYECIKCNSRNIIRKEK